MKHYLLMCPECGVILTKEVWDRRKSVTNLHYVCEKCDTKVHEDDLKRIFT